MKYQGFRLEFFEEKNLLLQETRDISFIDVLQAIKEDRILDNLKHSNKKYSHQKILAVQIGKYVYAVPYVMNQRKKTIFLKTIYPSRVLTDKYMKGGNKDEK